MSLRHFLADDDLTPAEQGEVLDLADRVKSDPYAFPVLRGPRSVAVLFDKSSTRTRVSFEAGVVELGGHPMIIDTSRSQLGRGESIADTARVYGRQVAAVVWRTFAQQSLAEMAEHAGVPVINALTDDYHPCQILADLQTVREHLGSTRDKIITYLGDGANNMANSWVLGGATAGLHVRIAAPPAYQPDPVIIQRGAAIAERTGGSVLVTTDADAAVAGAHVITTDTWVSMGQEDENGARSKAFAGYQVDDAVMAAADPGAVVLHCLPAYRGKEITASVLDGPQSAIWDEAENRRHVQKAVLIFLLAHQRGEPHQRGVR